MRTLAIAGLLLVAAAPASAAGDRELQAAQQELKVAQDHLRNAPQGEYGGHRRAAMDYIDKALQEIHQGLQYSRGEPSTAPAAKGKRRPTAPAEAPDEDED